jgi:hypothetical protein
MSVAEAFVRLRGNPGTGGFVKYALLIYKTDSYGDQLSGEALLKAADAFEAEVRALRNVSGVVRLQGEETATTVRVNEGRPLLTDGPFVDSKEVLGGLFLLDVANLDEATAVAARLQGHEPSGLAIEVRPVVE